jgi:hypothetical protein
MRRGGPDGRAELVDGVGVLDVRTGNADELHDERGEQRDEHEDEDDCEREQREAVGAKPVPEMRERRATPTGLVGALDQLLVTEETRSTDAHPSASPASRFT